MEPRHLMLQLVGKTAMPAAGVGPLIGAATATAVAMVASTWFVGWVAGLFGQDSAGWVAAGFVADVDETAGGP